MIKLSFKVNGLDKLDKKINKIIKELPQTVSKSVEDILKEMRITAVRIEKGHNDEGIICELVDMSKNKVKGRIYADPSKFVSNGQSYLWFEYFGTGSWAEQGHVGHTKHFLESGYTEWFIPVNKVARGLNYPIVTINNVQFYVAHGAKANHFLEKAEFETRSKNVETIKKNMDSFFREGCK